jgi:hypothetical protein
MAVHLISTGLSGEVANASQPAFCIKLHSGHSSPAAGATIAWHNSGERFDQGGDFASYTFTAPVTGKYCFMCHFRMNTIDKDNTYCYFNFLTSNATYEMSLAKDALGSGVDVTYQSKHGSVLADMDANDTCYIAFQFHGGVTCSSISSDSWFSGFLVC